jgi:hypothetical protein
MIDISPHHDWWDLSVLPNSYARDSILWDDLDGDIKLFVAIEELLTGERISCLPHTRLDWGQHLQKLLHKNRFHIRYGMSLDNFDALVKLLGDNVGTNVAMSNIRCNEAIYPEMTIAIGI